MREGEHFNPEITRANMANRKSARILFSLSGSLGYEVAQFDIKTAFPHEKLPEGYNIFVKQPRRGEGSFKKKEKYGRLRLNMYGSLAAGTV